jgi:two-component system, chemotaxis family, protein-glutamate methylesterase/glutaminase
MTRLRVLAVEDSDTVRRRMVEILAGDPEIDVVGEAADGKGAIALAQSLRPDIVTLDMMLPVMTGLAATEYIMAHCPTPILIVSASTNRGELHRTYDALAAGAVDVLEKPTGLEAPGDWEARFLAAVKRTARIKVITHPRARLQSARRVEEPVPARGKIAVVAIGASTGGPAAILELLRALPAPFPLPLLLALHIGEPFGTAFAEWLDGQSAHRVALARDGDPLAARAIGLRVAPPNRHLVVEAERLRLTDGPERNSCRPSVDVLFESMARSCGAAIAACLLTGMGRDGAAGLLAIRRAGGVTIAQDEASAVVYGMPREAVRLGAAQRVLPLDAIAPALVELAGGR